MTEKRASPARSCLWIAGSLVALAVVLAAALWFASRPATLQTVRLADGSTLRLEAVSYGAEETFLGNPLQRILYTLLPPPLKERSGAAAYRSTAPDTLTYWVTRTGNGNVSDGIAGTVVDEAGNESPPVNGQGLGNGRERYEFKAFPRRGQSANLRLYRRRDVPAGPATVKQVGWDLLGLAPAANPVRGPHPRWSPSPLPVTARSGDLDLTVSRLSLGGNPGGSYLSRGPGEAYCSATFRLSRGGKPAIDWYPGIRSISDATGNRWSIGSSASSSVPGGVEQLFPSPAISGEDAWKLEVQLTRTASAAFAPRELWQVRGIPLPRKGQGIPLLRKATVNGFPVELVGIYGPGAALPPGYDFIGDEDRTALLLRSTGAVPADTSRGPIRARDERGREVLVRMAASISNGAGTQELLRVDAPPGAKSFDFTYAVHAVRYVEIVVPNPTAAPGARRP
ncbi:MAG TPA: hypothetical protein VK689_19300 [Armatimonadota bacterium]|nr:hypothetical protein [Armatimonadota bacterium]